MESQIGFSFEKLAPYLTHPLVLTGFVLMLFFSMINKLMAVGILPKLTQKDGGKVVMLFLRYGFWLAALIALLGFGLQFFQTSQNTTQAVEKSKAEATHDINALVQTLMAKNQQDSQGKDEQIKALTAAITALSQGQGVIGSQSQINAALEALAQKDTSKAKDLFRKEAERVELAAKQGAEAYRNLGALAFLDNTQEALAAYQRATELDPDNADGWNRLGHLFQRVGELDQAIAAYQTVLKLGQSHQNQQEQAAAYGNLGLVYQTRGELDKAVEMYNKGLEIQIALGDKQGMAAKYGNLGVVYYRRGELDKAVEMYQKSLAITESLGMKETSANQYGNLGLVYDTRGELDKAAEMHTKALELNQALGRKEGMAVNYGNLGLVYDTRGDLDKAVEMYNKGLEIQIALGDKEGMANKYGNLGNVYEQKGNKAEAKRYWQKSIELFKYIGSPNEKLVQKWLDELK